MKDLNGAYQVILNMDETPMSWVWRGCDCDVIGNFKSSDFNQNVYGHYLQYGEFKNEGYQ